MKRIIVIGSPGAGKSTFARQLRDITGLTLYYLDMTSSYWFKQRLWLLLGQSLFEY